MNHPADILPIVRMDTDNSSDKEQKWRSRATVVAAGRDGGRESRRDLRPRGEREQDDGQRVVRLPARHEVKDDRSRDHRRERP